MHIHAIEDEVGDIIDIETFYSDFCHKGWCLENSVDYEGWNGCHETHDSDICAYCGEPLQLA